MSKLTVSSFPTIELQRRWHIPSLDTLIFVGGGLALLLIGSWFPNPRLNFFGIPVDSLVMASLVLLTTRATIRAETLKNLALAQIPLLILGLTIFWSPLPLVGLERISALIITSFFAFLLLNAVVERHGAEELAHALLLYLSALLLLAFVYKLKFGFFGRSVPFFVNGPIVFARFMSIALVIAIFTFTGKTRLLVSSIFIAAIVWTESRGPLLAALIAILVAIIVIAGPKRRTQIMISLVVILTIAWLIIRFYVLDNFDLGRLTFAFALLTGTYDVLGNNELSAVRRLDFWIKSIALIHEHPMGVGLGGWSDYIKTVKSGAYPHNLFMELWSEGGLVIGTLACIPLLLFIFATKGVFWCIALTLFLAQLVSGEISDARQMYVFSLLACFSVRKSRLRTVVQPAPKHPRLSI